jgi:uncharacterized protein
MYKIKALYLYPIKGLGRISVQKAYAETEGLQFDRRWMLITKSDSKFISQRSHPQMALFSLEINEDDFIKVSYKGDEISFHVSEFIDTTFYKAQVWDDTVKSVEVSKSVSKWFTNHLGEEVLLVKKAQDGKRLKHVKSTNSDTLVSYADGYPILILGTASMDEVNKRCPIEITDLRFRPNILIETTTPHEEDNLMTISKEDDVILKTVKPCVRCQVIQIDPITAISSEEPLKTLSEYRRENREIRFGSNAIVEEEGMLKVGDIFEIKS